METSHPEQRRGARCLQGIPPPGQRPPGIARGTPSGRRSFREQTMKTVAVLGGGPAGAFAAERLARAGLKATVFDEKLAWEKPCGGGLTYKAYNEYPFLMENSWPKKLVHETVIGAPKTGDAKLALAHPLVIYSRFDLNAMLLERAERAGAAIEKTASSRSSGVNAAGACERGMESLRPTSASWRRALATRCGRRDAVAEGRHRDRAGLLCAGVAGPDRYSISSKAGRVHLGVSALRASFGRDLGKGEPAQSLRARLELTCRNAGCRDRVHILQPHAAVT